MLLIVKAILAPLVSDSGAMEAAISASSADWTIVRPPRLLDGGRRRGYRIAVGNRPVGPASMQRADLADFLVEEAMAGEHVREIVGITATR